MRVVVDNNKQQQDQRQPQCNQIYCVNVSSNGDVHGCSLFTFVVDEDGQKKVDIRVTDWVFPLAKTGITTIVLYRAWVLCVLCVLCSTIKDDVVVYYCL